MRKANKKYFYIDLNVETMKIVNWGISSTATLTGETNDIDIYRIFLTQGQYNKLIKKIS